MSGSGIVPPLRPGLAAGARAFRAQGDWRDRQIKQLLAAELAADPDRIVARDGARLLTVRGLDEQARRLAGWMRAQGVGEGDVVAFQLPNWLEVFVIDMAAALLGAVSNPIVAIYRDAEVEFILRDARAKLFFAPVSFRSMDFAGMMARIGPRLPDLKAFVTVRGASELDYEAVLAGAMPVARGVPVSPDAPRLLLYTSGTTGRAKGVLHSVNTLTCEIANASAYWRQQRGDIMLMPSPLTHITGYLYGILFAELAGLTTVLMDRWDAAEALGLIEQYEIGAMVAATPFLQELAAAARGRGSRLPSLRLFACGGAPAAPETIRQATEAFERCIVLRVYGCTEAPTITLGAMERGSAAASGTEGYVVGHEVRLIDADGAEVTTGEEGEIVARGPEVMLGYLRAEDNEAAFDAEGYFHTGDLGRFDAEGALTITGRAKDLIIRGGENIAPKEIEDVLHRHPAIMEAAVVGMPHARLGEAPCAFLVLAEGAAVSREEVKAFLDAAGLAKQKIPERVEFRDLLPKTAAGKVQKFVLRDALAAGD